MKIFNQWTQLLTAKGLNPTERNMLGYIINWYNTTDGDFYLPIPKIESDLEISRATVKRTIKALKDKRLIESYASSYKTNIKAANGYLPIFDNVVSLLTDGIKNEPTGRVKNEPTGRVNLNLLNNKGNKKENNKENIIKENNKEKLNNEYSNIINNIDLIETVGIKPSSSNENENYKVFDLVLEESVGSIQTEPNPYKDNKSNNKDFMNSSSNFNSTKTVGYNDYIDNLENIFNNGYIPNCGSTNPNSGSKDNESVVISKDNNSSINDSLTGTDLNVIENKGTLFEDGMDNEKDIDSSFSGSRTKTDLNVTKEQKEQWDSPYSGSAIVTRDKQVHLESIPTRGAFDVEDEFDMICSNTADKAAQTPSKTQINGQQRPKTNEVEQLSTAAEKPSENDIKWAYFRTNAESYEKDPRMKWILNGIDASEVSSSKRLQCYTKICTNASRNRYTVIDSALICISLLTEWNCSISDPTALENIVNVYWNMVDWYMDEDNGFSTAQTKMFEGKLTKLRKLIMRNVDGKQMLAKIHKETFNDLPYVLDFPKAQ